MSISLSKKEEIRMKGDLCTLGGVSEPKVKGTFGWNGVKSVRSDSLNGSDGRAIEGVGLRPGVVGASCVPGEDGCVCLT